MISSLSPGGPGRREKRTTDESLSTPSSLHLFKTPGSEENSTTTSKIADRNEGKETNVLCSSSFLNDQKSIPLEKEGTTLSSPSTIPFKSILRRSGPSQGLYTNKKITFVDNTSTWEKNPIDNLEGEDSSEDSDPSFLVFQERDSAKVFSVLPCTPPLLSSSSITFSATSQPVTEREENVTDEPSLHYPQDLSDDVKETDRTTPIEALEDPQRKPSAMEEAADPVGHQQQEEEENDSSSTISENEQRESTLEPRAESLSLEEDSGPENHTTSVQPTPLGSVLTDESWKEARSATEAVSSSADTDNSSFSSSSSESCKIHSDSPAISLDGTNDALANPPPAISTTHLATLQALNVSTSELFSQDSSTFLLNQSSDKDHSKNHSSIQGNGSHSEYTQDTLDTQEPPPAAPTEQKERLSSSPQTKEPKGFSFSADVTRSYESADNSSVEEDRVHVRAATTDFYPPPSSSSTHDLSGTPGVSHREMDPQCAVEHPVTPLPASVQERKPHPTALETKKREADAVVLDHSSLTSSSRPDISASASTSITVEDHKDSTSLSVNVSSIPPLPLAPVTPEAHIADTVAAAYRHFTASTSSSVLLDNTTHRSETVSPPRTAVGQQEEVANRTRMMITTGTTTSMPSLAREPSEGLRHHTADPPVIGMGWHLEKEVAEGILPYDDVPIYGGTSYEELERMHYSHATSRTRLSDPLRHGSPPLSSSYPSHMQRNSVIPDGVVASFCRLLRSRSGSAAQRGVSSGRNTKGNEEARHKADGSPRRPDHTYGRMSSGTHTTHAPPHLGHSFTPTPENKKKGEVETAKDAESPSTNDLERTPKKNRKVVRIVLTKRKRAGAPNSSADPVVQMKFTSLSAVERKKKTLVGSPEAEGLRIRHHTAPNPHTIQQEYAEQSEKARRRRQHASHTVSPEWKSMKGGDPPPIPPRTKVSPSSTIFFPPKCLGITPIPLPPKWDSSLTPLASSSSFPFMCSSRPSRVEEDKNRHSSSKPAMHDFSDANFSPNRNFLRGGGGVEGEDALPQVLVSHSYPTVPASFLDPVPPVVPTGCRDDLSFGPGVVRHSMPSSGDGRMYASASGDAAFPAPFGTDRGGVSQVENPYRTMEAAESSSPSVSPTFPLPIHSRTVETRPTAMEKKPQEAQVQDPTQAGLPNRGETVREMHDASHTRQQMQHATPSLSYPSSAPHTPVVTALFPTTSAMNAPPPLPPAPSTRTAGVPTTTSPSPEKEKNVTQGRESPHHRASQESRGKKMTSDEKEKKRRKKKEQEKKERKKRKEDKKKEPDHPISHSAPHHHHHHHHRSKQHAHKTHHHSLASPKEAPSSERAGRKKHGKHHEHERKSHKRGSGVAEKKGVKGDVEVAHKVLSSFDKTSGIPPPPRLSSSLQNDSRASPLRTPFATSPTILFPPPVDQEEEEMDGYGSRPTGPTANTPIPSSPFFFVPRAHSTSPSSALRGGSASTTQEERQSLIRKALAEISARRHSVFFSTTPGITTGWFSPTPAFSSSPERPMVTSPYDNAETSRGMGRTGNSYSSRLLQEKLPSAFTAQDSDPVRDYPSHLLPTSTSPVRTRACLELSDAAFITDKKGMQTKDLSHLPAMDRTFHNIPSSYTRGSESVSALASPPHFRSSFCPTKHTETISTGEKQGGLCGQVSSAEKETRPLSFSSPGSSSLWLKERIPVTTANTTTPSTTDGAKSEASEGRLQWVEGKELQSLGRGTPVIGKEMPSPNFYPFREKDFSLEKPTFPAHHVGKSEVDRESSLLETPTALRCANVPVAFSSPSIPSPPSPSSSGDPSLLPALNAPPSIGNEEKKSLEKAGLPKNPSERSRSSVERKGIVEKQRNRFADHPSLAFSTENVKESLLYDNSGKSPFPTVCGDTLQATISSGPSADEAPHTNVYSSNLQPETQEINAYSFFSEKTRVTPQEKQEKTDCGKEKRNDDDGWVDRLNNCNDVYVITDVNKAKQFSENISLMLHYISVAS